MTIVGYRLEMFYWLILLVGTLPMSDQIVEVDSSYACRFIDNPINIDGQLEEGDWSLAVRSSGFTNIESCDEVPFQTSFRSLFDSSYLYFGVIAHEPDIRASITQDNKRLYKYDPTIELFLDPNGDGRDYYELQINANNAIWQLSFDKPLKDGGRVKNPITIDGLRTAVYISGTLNDDSDIDQYWSIEIAIPWSALGDRATLLSQMWKINLGRVHHKDDKSVPQFWAWSCPNTLDLHLPATWGNLSFKGQP